VLDHVLIEVDDIDPMRALYEAALAPLGVEIASEPAPNMLGFGEAGTPFFWVMERGRPRTQNSHVCFGAPSREAVDAFHAAGVAAGGTDNGAPGVRSYHASYYSAFVLYPDGNNIEAVCHAPVGTGQY
jgi:catechol 2,3-dioxygenase-like lactoylglutathione lyase family enzyme